MLRTENTHDILLRLKVPRRGVRLFHLLLEDTGGDALDAVHGFEEGAGLG